MFAFTLLHTMNTNRDSFTRLPCSIQRGSATVSCLQQHCHPVCNVFTPLCDARGSGGHNGRQEEPMTAPLSQSLKVLHALALDALPMTP